MLFIIKCSMEMQTRMGSKKYNILSFNLIWTLKQMDRKIGFHPLYHKLQQWIAFVRIFRGKTCFLFISWTVLLVVWAEVHCPGPHEVQCEINAHQMKKRKSLMLFTYGLMHNAISDCFFLLRFACKFAFHFCLTTWPCLLRIPDCHLLAIFLPTI